MQLTATSASSFILFLRATRTPKSTLFPYTTLFRSMTAPKGLIYYTLNGVDPRLPGGSDRKSTRLNSSHMSISYAVFCWKKKISIPVIERPSIIDASNLNHAWVKAIEELHGVEPPAR